MASSAVELQERKTKEQNDTRRESKSLIAPAPPTTDHPLIKSIESFSTSAPASLTLLLARIQQYDLLNSAYRSYLSTHLESGQVWYLLALSLLVGSRMDESFLAIRECLTRCGDDIPALLLAGQISLRLRKGKESVEYSSRAMRACKQQQLLVQRSAAMAQAIADANTANSKNPPTTTTDPVLTSPRTLDLIASGLSASSINTTGTSNSAHSFRPLSHHPQIHSSLLQTCQLLFGVCCSRYAYHVSTFSNRKSLQKRALHALENAYKQQLVIGGGTVSNKHLVFALACLNADIREIPRAISLTKHALELDRSDVHSWNLLALLLSSQKKYRSALAACDHGVQVITATTSLTHTNKDIITTVPLQLTRSKLQAHLGLYDEAVLGFVELCRALFGADVVHMKTYGPSSTVATTAASSPSTTAPARVRPTFHPSRKSESTEKNENARMDQTMASSLEAQERITAQIETLLALAQVYAAQANVLANSGSTSTKDDSWLNDAFDAVHFAREMSPTHFLPDIHAALASLAVQSGSFALAVRHYESALVLDAHHTASLLGLARIETQRAGGNLVLAYGYLMSALQVDGTSHHAWYEMGVILQTQGKSSAAAEHFITSLELEKTAPIASFHSIPRRVAQ